MLFWKEICGEGGRTPDFFGIDSRMIATKLATSGKLHVSRTIKLSSNNCPLITWKYIWLGYDQTQKQFDILEKRWSSSAFCDYACLDIDCQLASDLSWAFATYLRVSRWPSRPSHTRLRRWLWHMWHSAGLKKETKSQWYLWEERDPKGNSQTLSTLFVQLRLIQPLFTEDYCARNAGYRKPLGTWFVVARGIAPPSWQYCFKRTESAHPVEPTAFENHAVPAFASERGTDDDLQAICFIHFLRRNLWRRW